MRCDLAEPALRPVAPRVRLAGMLAVLLGALGALTGCSHDVSIAPPTATPDLSSARAAGAQKTLTALSAAIADHDAGAARALAAPGASPLLTAIVANARALGVRTLALHFVDADLGALNDQERARYGDGAWVGAVRLDYTIPRWDTGPTRMETAFTFVSAEAKPGVRIAAVGGHGDRSPLWLGGPVTVLHQGRALVIDAGSQDPRRYLARAVHAVTDVNRVLPSWRGQLVLEVPRDEAQLDSVLDADQKTYANIAAVTTTVDGSLTRGSPVHVFLNPRVFDTLKAKGSQVVLSHETTHVATGASFAAIPTWLLEGFADYVALAHAGVPVQVAAHQILTRIRKHGLPTHLPSTRDLNPEANGLGATYEEAWLACRYLARQYGEQKLVAFYDRVDGGVALGTAFRSVLGTSERGFLAGWRGDLRRLARGGVAG